MKNLVLEEFDLHEFNKWMLDIQKLEQKINCVLNIFGVWHIKITLNELFKDPDVICNKYLSKEAISKRVFRENNVQNTVILYVMQSISVKERKLYLFYMIFATL